MQNGLSDRYMLKPEPFLQQRYNVIFLRAETADHEYRTPIVPNDIPTLLDHGFTVWVQRSSTRAFSDQEFADRGALLTSLCWNEFHPESVTTSDLRPLVVGLKDIHVDFMDGHHHMYFSHSYKGQRGAPDILRAFRRGGMLWDVEYFLKRRSSGCIVDDVENQKLVTRCLSFGFYAGICGCILGLLQLQASHGRSSAYLSERPVLHESLPTPTPLQPWDSLAAALEKVRRSGGIANHHRIAVLGPDGECGRGVRHVLHELGLSATLLGRMDSKQDLGNHHLILNCIKLDETQDELWDITPIGTTSSSSVLLVDVSCDVTKPNHPFRHLYTTETTWNEPVNHVTVVGGKLDVICISNLPSLLPRDSSTYFSRHCVPLLTHPEDHAFSWQSCHQAFLHHVART